MKKDLMIFVLVIVVIFYIPTQIAAVWKKHITLEVEGKITRLYDLCDSAYRTELNNFHAENPILEVYLGEIVGMSVGSWQSFEIEKESSVYIFDSNGFALPLKLASKSRPVLYHYEIYELEKIFYLKVVFLVKNKKDCVEEYIAYYKYTNLTPKAVEALSERELSLMP